MKDSLKEEMNPRISEEAVEKLTNWLTTYIGVKTNKAYRYALHSGRSTLMKKDLEEVL